MEGIADEEKIKDNIWDHEFHLDVRSSFEAYTSTFTTEEPFRGPDTNPKTLINSCIQAFSPCKLTIRNIVPNGG